MKTLHSIAVVAVSLGLSSFFNSAGAVCTFGPGTPGEASLQTVMDRLLVNDSVNTATGCLSDNIDSHWTASGPSAATVIVEIAGFANQNTFGIYDMNNSANMIQIFAGSAGRGSNAQIDFTSNGSGYDVTITQGTQSTTGSMSSNAFGFYLRTPQNYTFFSDTSLNTADNADHLYAFRGNGDTFDTTAFVPPTMRGTDFSQDRFILAWEDLINGGDGDFQDMVVLGEFIFPVPAPAALWLLAAALPMFGFAARNKI